MNEPGYLDHNATTPIRPEALEAVTRIAGMLGNPSSVHQYGRDVRRHIEDARDALASLVHAEPADVIFTSSGTEANNLALRGVGRDRVFVSAVEHVSVLEVRQGVSLIPVDENGVVNCKALEAMLAEDTAPALVSVMFANNETGVLQPIEDISAIAKQHDAWVHCDAVQGAGKAAINIDALGVDMLSLSSHKIGGPQGAGALIVQDTVGLGAIIHGGGQERNHRGGTENASSIAGFGVAAQCAANCKDEAARIGILQQDLEDRARAVLSDTQIYGETAARLTNTTCLTMPGVSSETQVMALDLAGVAVSAGAACSSGKVGASHVLEAMGVGDGAGDAIRVSLGWTTSAGDIERFIGAWTALNQRVLDPA
jgi:cysteine desulfurase